MPDPLPTDPVELERHVRSLVAVELLAAGGETPELRPRVQSRPQYVNTEAEWLKVAGVKYPQGGIETRVVFLEFLGFGERDEGACDATILTLSYGVDVLYQLVNERRDGSNSHDDFVAYVIRARARFKADRSFGYNRSEFQHKLLQTELRARVEKIDFGTVHRINLVLDVEVG